MQDNKWIIGVACVAVILLSAASLLKKPLNINLYNPTQNTQGEAVLGTGMTLNTSNGKYTEGADMYQNIQAMAERMTALTQYQILQANSSGNMEAVSTASNLTLSSPTITGANISDSNFVNDMTSVAATVASTTVTAALTGTTYVFTTTTEFVLPATSTAAGLYYKFVVGGAITSNVTIRTYDLSNNIEGTLIVAGAVLDCDAEDVITFVADGENIGDYVELYSDGTYWYIGDSGALTASKLTCTAT